MHDLKIEHTSGFIKSLSEIKWASVPIELYLFIFYEIAESVITIVSPLILNAESIDSLTALMDWNHSNGFNIVFIFFAIIFISNRSIKIRNTLLALFVINIIFICIEIFLFSSKYQWIQIWNILITTVWLLVFLGPRIKKYCK